MFIMDKKILVVPKWFGNNPEHIRKLFNSDRLDIYLKYYKSLFRPIYIHSQFVEVYVARQILDECTWDLTKISESLAQIGASAHFNFETIESNPKDGSWKVKITSNEQPSKHQWTAEICKAK